MKLGWVLVYVKDVARAVDFYERAFGLKRRFVHDSGQYAEMETGESTLGFVAEDLARSNLPAGIRPLDPSAPPFGVEIALVTEDVPAAWERATAAGAASTAPPKQKPWGQTVAYVRDPEGMLVELATPMG
jgi:uncharacterized glyoxalase superfamily protein PhnB